MPCSRNHLVQDERSCKPRTRLELIFEGDSLMRIFADSVVRCSTACPPPELMWQQTWKTKAVGLFGQPDSVTVSIDSYAVPPTKYLRAYWFRDSQQWCAMIEIGEVRLAPDLSQVRIWLWSLNEKGHPQNTCWL